jgi:hypothetical protein
MYYHRSVGGYHPAKLRLYQDLIENQLSKDSLNTAVLDMLDTKYLLLPNQQGSDVGSVQQNTGALGAAWFVGRLQPVNGPAAEMKALDHFDPRQVAFYDQKSERISAQPAPDASASIRLAKYDNDTVLYVTNAATPQFAVFSEIYYPAGWNAYLDGKKTDYYKVDYLLRGMPVPAGQHTITFRFEPASYITGYKVALWSGILLYLALAAAAFVLWRKRRNRTENPPHATDPKPRLV